MSNNCIGGLLQIGIGVKNMPIARKWYADHLHFDTIALEEKSVTHLMTAYTGGEGHNRHASVVMNMAGAGGLEVWQYLSRKPKFPAQKITLGDLGIFCAIIGSDDVATFYNTLQDVLWKSDFYKLEQTFFFCDPYGNYFQVVHDSKKSKKLNRGTIGALIGCSNLDNSIDFYCKVLGYSLNERLSAKTHDLYAGLPGGDRKFNKAILTKNTSSIGGFSKFLGGSVIHLVEAKNYQPVKIYQDRYWGDPGFIHLCYDVTNMEAIKSFCTDQGHPFTVDSIETENGKSFEMGKVTSRVAYIDDPDGTAIEFVETHKLPLIAGIALNLQKRTSKKNVPNWVLQLLSLRKVTKS